MTGDTSGSSDRRDTSYQRWWMVTGGTYQSGTVTRRGGYFILEIVGAATGYFISEMSGDG